MKVLIVDDEQLIRMSLSRLFSKRGHQVFEAGDGLQGLELWQKHKPDLLLLDWIMPNMNGNQLLLRMKDQHLGAVVHVMSAYTNETNIDELKALGVTSFISKPFENVIEIVNNLEASFE